jgi:hypothetical protein
MKPIILFVAAILGSFGCSSTKAVLSERRHLELSSIEQMDFGKISTDEITNLIGKPDQIIPLKRDLAGNDAWIYIEESGDQKLERLGLLVDHRTGIAQSATWAVREGDLLRQKDTALSHFKGAEFTQRQAGQVARDYASDDSTYSDRKSGISFQVDGANQTVNMISFEPSLQRKLAKDQK